MRTFIPLVLTSAVMLTSCTTTAPPPEIPAAQASSAQCIDGMDWAASARRGASLFNSSCSYCHGGTGAGQTGQVPALAGNKGLIADPDRGIRMLLRTQMREPGFHGMEYDDMIAILGELNDDDLADLMTYVLSSWGNCAGPIGPERIAAVAATLN